MASEMPQVAYKSLRTCAFAIFVLHHFIDLDVLLANVNPTSFTYLQRSFCVTFGSCILASSIFREIISKLSLTM